MNFETSIAHKESDTEYFDAQQRAEGRRRWLLIAVAALVIAAVLLGAWFAMNATKPIASTTETTATKTGAAPAKTGKNQAPSVTVVVPGTQLVENFVTATGTLAARMEMPVGAAGEGGLVTRVWVQPGTWVRQGQVLASVDRQVQVQQSVQGEGQIVSAQADARLAQAELDRANALAGRGFISKADIQRKLATRDSAVARVGIARAQLREMQARMGKLDIRAPAAGLVLTRTVEPGQIVGPGSGVLFRIAQGGNLELKALLSEADLLKMRVGLLASVTPVGSLTAFNGVVWQLSPIIDPQSRQGTVRIALSYSRDLRPGGFAATKIESGTAVTPMLPESAVQSDAKGNYVYVVTADNKVERRTVVVGAVKDSGVSIISGLSGQERVVLSAGGFLNAGESVVANLAKTPAKVSDQP
jgi:HlyD family secretion protein